MRHDYLLIMTHLGADLEDFLKTLGSHPDISLNMAPLTYTSPLSLHSLASSCKQKSARIYANPVVLNHSIKDYSVLDYCLCIYYLDEPIPSIFRLVSDFGYSKDGALSYYSFRLQRLAYLAKKTPRAKLITPQMENINKEISDLLRLSRKPLFKETKNDEVEPESVLDQQAYRVYAKYSERIKVALEYWNNDA